jgi:hypothetical protein
VVVFNFFPSLPTWNLIMRKICVLIFGLMMVCCFVTGCGGAPEEADTSHLSSPESDDAAAAARASYENVGKGGPGGAKAPSSGRPGQR